MNEKTNEPPHVDANGAARSEETHMKNWLIAITAITLILIVAIVMPILGLNRHRRMIDWWLSRSRTVEMLCGTAAFIFGVGLIYLIL